MRVDIWSDVVCPFCYLGKARFEKALSTFAHRDQVEVVYRAFELDPGYPKDQYETNLSMLSRKYGMSEADARAADGRLAGLAAAESLGFDPERPLGNTFDTHRVLQLGLAKGVQAEVLKAVNQAYFAEARSIFDRDVLTEIATGAGLDATVVGAVLDGDAFTDEVHKDEVQAHELGISGVPFYVFDMALGVSGAQSAQTFTSALNQAWDTAG